MGRSLSRGIAVGVVVAAASLARAESPEGEYTLSVGGEAEIWQPDGFSESCEVVDGDELCFTIDASTDTAGGVTAAGTLTLSGSVTGELAIPLTGNVSGASAKSKFTLTGPIDGQLTDGVIVLDVTGSATFKCKEDPFDAALFQCKPKLKLCAYYLGEKIDCQGIKGKSGETTVSAIGGPWELGLVLATDVAGNVTGVATAELASGQVLDFSATGKYNAKSDTSKLDLVGVGSGAGSRLKLSKLALAGGGAGAGKLKMSPLAGQKGKAVLAAPVLSTMD